jgi:hypothetical protein
MSPNPNQAAKPGAKQPTAAEKAAAELAKLVESITKRTDLLIPEGFKQAESGAISAMERTVTTLKGLLKNPKLPKDVSLDIQRQIQKIESSGYKYYINDCLKKARTAALAHDDKMKNNMVKLARDTLPKALSAGAGNDFKDMVTKIIEVIQLTGTPVVGADGTKAKPVDKNAPPPPPNRAKLPEEESDKKPQ